MPVALTEKWTHPYRSDNLAHWEWLWATYQGGLIYLAQQYPRQFNSTKFDEAARKRVHFIRTAIENSMLRRHERESDEGYDQRLDFATPINIVRPLVETIAAAVAKVGKISLPEDMEEFTKDVDGRGSDVTEFTRQACSYVLVLPTFIELERRDPNAQVATPAETASTDAPEYSAPAETETPAPTRGPSVRELRDAGVRTFARHVTALDLMHWSWDAGRNRFRWYLVREHLPLNIAPPVGGDAKESGYSEQCYACKLVWDDYVDEGGTPHPAGWQRFVDGKLTDAGPRYWPEGDAPPLFPIILGQDPQCAEPFGNSETEDASALQRLILNLHSWYIDDLYNNAFHQTIIDTEEMPEDADRLFGASTWIRGKGGTLLSPNPAVFDHMAEAVRFHMVLARQRMGLEERGSDAQESGAALALRRENFSSFLAGIATAMEGALRAAFEAAARMDGANDEDVEVVFSKDFEAYNIAARLDAILNVWDKMSEALPVKAKAVVLKDAVRAITPELPEDERTAVEDEIDTATEEKEAEAAKNEAAQREALSARGKLMDAAAKRKGNGASVMPGEPGPETPVA